MTRRITLCILLFGIGCSMTSFALENTFWEAALGYSIDYPAGWVVERPSDYTVRLTGAAGGPAADVALVIQNVASAAIGGTFATADELLTDLKCQLVAGSGDICLYLGEPVTVVDADGRTLRGPQLLADYEYAGGLYREWLAVVPHGSGTIFYVLSFTGLQGDYERFESTVQDMISSWTIGAAGPGATSTGSTGSAGTGSIVVLLEDIGHIGPYNYAQGTFDKRYYDVVITTHGYLAIAVIDEAGESISGWVYTPGGIELTHKAGNFSEIYTDAYEVFPGTYQIKVGQDTMVTESDFKLFVYFSASPFGIDDLVAAFGSRYQVMP